MSAVVKQSDYHTRPMVDDDINDVMDIETTVYHFPWTKQIFKDCLRIGYSCLVATIDEEIVGYAIMSSGASEGHLLNICVKHSHQGQGVGKMMLHTMIQVAKEKNVHTLFLEVRPSNRIALDLYLKTGFNEIGERKNYYPAKGGREDAVILALTIA